MGWIVLMVWQINPSFQVKESGSSGRIAVLSILDRAFPLCNPNDKRSNSEN